MSVSTVDRGQIGQALSRVVPFAAMVLGGGIALTAALLTHSAIGGPAASVEGASAAASTWLGALPLSYAFGAGMVSAVNPCGFAMLPAYIGFYLAEGRDPVSPGRPALWRALLVSVTMAAGFVLLFGAAGVGLGLATSTVAAYFPWLGLAIGLALLFVGGSVLRGSSLYLTFGERLADRLGSTTHQGGVRAYFAYGLAYGAASLSCTLPVFLAVVGSGTSAGGFSEALLQFVLYALGMSLVVTVLTLAMTLFKEATLARTRRIMPYVQPGSAILLLLAGTYIVYYWLTLGGLLPRAS